MILKFDYLCSLKNWKINIKITRTNEKDISAIKKEEDKYSRFQGENVNSKWQTRSLRTQSKGKKETDRFRRTGTQRLKRLTDNKNYPS